MWVWPSIAVTILLIVKTHAYKSSLAQNVNGLKIDCGETIDSLVNVTYTGDVYGVYSVENELGCKADRIDVVTYKFIGVNKMPCGMEWIEHLNTLHLKIRVQAIFLVTDDDIYYELECIYGKQAATQHNIQIIDRSVIAADEIAHDAGDTAIPGAGVMEIKIYNPQMPSIQETKVFQSDEKIKVKVTLMNPNDDVDVVVTECMFQDTSEKPNFLHKFINNGCGTGTLLQKGNQFTVVSKGSTLESPYVPVKSLQGFGQVIVKCLVTVCMVGTSCVLTCPSEGDDMFLENREGEFVINTEPFSVKVPEKQVVPATTVPPTVIENILQTTKTITTSTQPTTTTTTTTTTAIPITVKPKITTTSAKQLSDFDDPKTLPYAIVVIVLSFVIVSLLILIIVLAVKLKRSRANRRPFHFRDRNRLHLGYRSKHHSKSHLLQPIFMSPSSSESGSRSGSDDGERYIDESRSRKIPASRADSYDRQMSYGDEMMERVPARSRSEARDKIYSHSRSDSHEKRRPESSRSRSYSPGRSRSHVRERSFSPSRSRSDVHASRSRSDIHEGNSKDRGQRSARAYYDGQASESRDRREKLQSWEREPRPDYKRNDNYRSRWEVMEPIMEELQNSDRMMGGDRTKF